MVKSFKIMGRIIEEVIRARDLTDVHKGVCPDEAPTPVADGCAENIDNQHDQRPDRGAGKNADERGEVHMHPAGERDVHLKYGKGYGGEQCRGGESLGREGLAACDEERYGKHAQRERPPDDHPLERKHPIRQMNMCHNRISLSALRSPANAFWQL